MAQSAWHKDTCLMHAEWEQMSKVQANERAFDDTVSEHYNSRSPGELGEKNAEHCKTGPNQGISHVMPPHTCLKSCNQGTAIKLTSCLHDGPQVVLRGVVICCHAICWDVLHHDVVHHEVLLESWE